MPWKELAESGVLHVLAVLCIALTGNLWLGRKSVTLNDPLNHTTISYYKTEDFFPAVETEKPKTSSRAQSKHDPVKALQEVISVPPDPDNSEQTIANLEHPELLQRTEPLPNLIVTPTPKFAAEVPKLTAPQIAFKPVTPKIEGIREATMERVANEQSAIEIAQDQAAAVANPKLALPAMAPRIDVAPPPSPVTPRDIANDTEEARAAAQVLVLNARPSLTLGEIKLPDGSRKGVFAASPAGREGAAGTPGIDPSAPAAREIASGGSSTIGAISAGQGAQLPAGISVAGPKGTELAAAINPVGPVVRVQKPLPKVVLDAPSVIRPALPSRASSADIPRESTIRTDSRKVDEVFGTKRVYSMQIDLPNLTSAGGSWQIRFAEMKDGAPQGELSTPVPTIKVDPAYPPSLQKDGVQGMVVLFAIIHADGTVGEIRLLHSLHERLDESARLALSRWKFRPATKSGEPVDIEAVVQIPFYARKIAY